jgi:hypothetical protein
MNATSSAVFFSCVLMAEADGSQWGWLAGAIGGVLGTVLGIGGGVFGTHCSIKNTRTAAERRFMIHFSVAIWLAVVSLVCVPVALSQFGLISVWFQWTLFALFFVMLVPSIVWVNRHLVGLRGTDRQHTTEVI